MRLVNGTTPSEGKVVICYNRRWGTVCSYYWDTVEAGIVCRQLGFESICLASSFTTSCNIVNLSYFLQMVFLVIHMAEDLDKVIITIFHALEMRLISRVVLLVFVLPVDMLK